MYIIKGRGCRDPDGVPRWSTVNGEKVAENNGESFFSPWYVSYVCGCIVSAMLYILKLILILKYYVVCMNYIYHTGLFRSIIKYYWISTAIAENIFLPCYVLLNLLI